MVQKDWGKATNSISCAWMRQVSGFERPAVQWLFVALSIVLIGIAAGEAVALRRARAQMESLRAEQLNARIEAEQLRAQLAREQAAREAFALELARQRGSGAPVSQPTLTLSPLTRRSAQSPEPTVARPPDSQVIQLRLLLPAAAKTEAARYKIAVRMWTGGEAVWSRGGLTMSTVEGKRMVTSFITGDVLGAGAYEIALTTDAADKSADVAAYEVAVRAADHR
jgi:hypothetical protein